MIVHSQESGKKASLIDLLGGNTKGKTAGSGDIFSKLLGSLAAQLKGDGKSAEADFKAVIDPKNVQSKSPSTNLTAITKELAALLGGNDENQDALISKELLNVLSDDQVRSLIYRAKEQLKNQIAAKSPEYQTEAKPFPKTLIGLVRLADKLGLEPESITLSGLTQDDAEQKNIPAELLSKPLFDAKALAKLPAEPQIQDSFDAITQLLRERKAQGGKPAAPIQTGANETVADETLKAIEPQPLKNLLQTLDKRPVAAESSAQNETIKPSETKTAPLTANKAEALITLLQGDLSAKETHTDETSSAKTENALQKGMQIQPADSFEVKAKEAQQSMRLFATDLKEAVESYKPPFTRLTMKLNPEKLGEVEVTLVQRGNNVHVNIQSSNTSSIAFLAHNATELKAQLAHQGITNATMNFMSGGDGQAQQQQQQQNHNRFHAYQSFEELEFNDEQLSALEIIIPHYA